MPEYLGRRKFVAKNHLTYGPTSLTAEPGDIVGDLPPESIGWLLEQGHIAEVEVKAETTPRVPRPRRSTE